MAAQIPPLLSLRNISKVYGDCVACEDVNLDVHAGTIHAVVGENGAGKSTAMKMLFGLTIPSGGEILWQGKSVHFRSSLDAIRSGIGMVHQHFMLAENLSALDNVLLQRRGKNPFRWLDTKKEKEEVEKLAEIYGLSVPLDRLVKDLSVGEQQRLEILKSLLHNPKLLILDEPTAVLTPQEIEPFFSQLKRLKAGGTTIIVITHKLKEVLAIADEVTVLRKGRSVYCSDIRDTTIEDLAVAMTGQNLQKSSRGDFGKNRGRRSVDGERKPLLQIKNLHAGLQDQEIHSLQLDLFPGEIIGIAGVEGNGQDVLLRALLDPRDLRIVQGTVQVGKTETLSKLGALNARALRELGIRALPEDRLRWGVVREMSLQENWLLTHSFSRQIQRFGFLQKKKIAILTDKIVEDFKVTPEKSDLSLQHFSGGNQQKFVVGREVMDQPQILIAAHPTRGVDIGAIYEIHQNLLKLSSRGTGILLVSSELEEILTLADRVFVLHRGRWTGHFERSALGFDEKRIGLAMAGKEVL